MVYSSTQHPTEIQHMVARVLGLPTTPSRSRCRRMGGGFGGKETQAALFAAIAALVARKTGRPAKCRLDRDDDMIMTGKRHDFRIDYEVGFDDDGRIQGVDMRSRGALRLLGRPLRPRSPTARMFHADNAYYLPAVRIARTAARPTPSPTPPSAASAARRAWSAIERVIDEIAYAARARPARGAAAQLLRRATARNVTPYRQSVEDNVIAGDRRRAGGRRPTTAARRAGDPRLQRAKPDPEARASR